MKRLSGLVVDLILARIVLPVVAGYAVKFVKQRKGKAV